MKYSIWEWTALTLTFLSILWVILVYTFSPNLPSNIQKIDRKELLNTVGNGDLLFLSGGTFAEKVIKFWHNSYYSHVAIIFEDSRNVINPTKENTLFVFESDVGQNMKDGPRVMRLADKLNKWKGDKIGMVRKYYGERPSTLNIINLINQYVGRGMDLNMLSWFFAGHPNSPIFKYLKSENKMFCSELVAETLQNLGYIKKNRHPASYTPQDFSTIIPEKGFYSFPMYFSF